jgi:thioredoxin 1
MVRQVSPRTSMAEFRQQTEGQAFTVVDFFAEWCGPCKAIAPQVEQMAALHPHITFLKCDVDQCPEISGACSISSMPTFILFARGTEIGRTTGADASKLRDMLQRATSTASSAPVVSGYAPSALRSVAVDRLGMFSSTSSYSTIITPLKW